MKENTRTWLLAIGAATLAAFAGLAYHLHPGIVAKMGLDLNDLGEAAVAALVLFLFLRRPQAITLRTRIILGAVAAVGLLVGLAVFFIS